jgi:hypothetical protein
MDATNCERCGQRLYARARFCTPGCRDAFYRLSPPPGAEFNGQGRLQGRDVRGMTRADLRDMGFEPMSAQAALRAHCLDCCAGSADEVRRCMALKCPSWPFRLGRSPWKEMRVMSEEQRAAASERLRARNIAGRSADALNTVDAGAGMVGAATPAPPEPIGMG